MNEENEGVGKKTERKRRGGNVDQVERQKESTALLTRGIYSKPYYRRELREK